jgi:hypothetical protein
MNRVLANWLDSFMEYTAKQPSPEVFRRWTGISILAAALERKVWIETSVAKLYPNLYIFIIAPPAVGKSIMTSEAWRMVSSLRDHKIASPSITRATMIEELDEAKRFKQHATGTISFNALYICINELGVLLPEYEMAMMNKLTDIYDGHPYGESRRNKKHSATIKHPMYNMLAAGTPGYLASMLPEVAWEQGFMSRVLIIYSGDIIRFSLFGRGQADEELRKTLVKDLQLIGNLYGEFTFTPEAATAMDAFYLGEHNETAPMHPKLQHYNTRRPTHLMKLMMIASITRGSDFLITGEDYAMAFAWLTDAEAAMPQIFKAMNSGGDIQIMQEVWYYVFEQMAKRSVEGLPESSLVAFLSQRVPVEKIKWILEVMKNSGLLASRVTPAGMLWAAKGNPKK